MVINADEFCGVPMNTTVKEGEPKCFNPLIREMAARTGTGLSPLEALGTIVQSESKVFVIMNEGSDQ